MEKEPGRQRVTSENCRYPFWGGGLTSRVAVTGQTITSKKKNTKGEKREMGQKPEKKEATAGATWSKTRTIKDLIVN